MNYLSNFYGFDNMDNETAQIVPIPICAAEVRGARYVGPPAKRATAGDFPPNKKDSFASASCRFISKQ